MSSPRLPQPDEIRRRAGSDSSLADNAVSNAEGTKKARKPGRPFTPESARRAVEARRRKAEERLAQASSAPAHDPRPLSARVGAALHALSDEDITAVVQAAVRDAKAGKWQGMQTLARIAPQDSGEDTGGGDDWATMSRKDREALLARLSEPRHPPAR